MELLRNMTSKRKPIYFLIVQPSSSPLVRLVEGEERWDALDHFPCIIPPNWGGNEPNRTVTSMVLKATANNRRQLAFCNDEFCGPRSGLC
ncbi:zinc finger protein [Trichonephila clavipes]|nr:zinc finger protein [Trichonephila clavipes]